MKSGMSIEPGILPLVDAINSLNFLETFSSCEGHYEKEHQELMDRNKADVRFDPLPQVKLEKVEHFITYLITEFNREHGFDPITLTGHKMYAPDDDYRPHFTFVLELSPFDRFYSPTKKRATTNIAIKQAVELIKKYKKEFPYTVDSHS
jgi:hypothetical protein